MEYAKSEIASSSNLLLFSVGGWRGVGGGEGKGAQPMHVSGIGIKPKWGAKSGQFFNIYVHRNTVSQPLASKNSSVKIIFWYLQCMDKTIQ
jgi:hypothetical protein